MSTDLNQIVDQMRTALAISEPDLDTSAGTVTRKILDAVAESISEAYLDQHMLTYTYDIDSKTEGDLDTFCQTVGGITRLPARRATGNVTFSRSGLAATTTTVLIPVNTQVMANDGSNVVVATVTGGSLAPGQTSVTIPVTALDSGAVGNLAAGTLTIMPSPIDGVSTVNNVAALSGGLDQETDTQLRARWKQTVFRSMAGTSSMYQALALDQDSVTTATVIGSSVTRIEQVQCYAATTGTYNGKNIAQSVCADVAYAFPNGVLVGPDIANGNLLVPGSDYIFDNSVKPPVVIFNNAQYWTGAYDANGNQVMANTVGGVFELQYNYTPTTSRNDPDGTRFNKGSIMNRVDVVIGGQEPVAAFQSTSFSNKNVFQNTNSAAPYYTGNFIRQDGSAPTVGNLFIPLTYGPIISVPDVINVGSSSYGRVGSTASCTYPNSYRVVHDNTSFGYTSQSKFGLEWLPSSGQYVAPSNGAVFTIGDNGSYIYDQAPAQVQTAIDRWRLAGVDAQVHAARKVYLRVSLAIMYSRTYSISATNAAIDQAVSTLFSSMSLGDVVQGSDIVAAVHSVSGVDNVRLVTPNDYANVTNPNLFDIGIQQVVNGTVTQTYVNNGRLQDVTLTGNQWPVLEVVRKLVKAQNTFQAS